MAGPLAGLRVVELAGIGPAPYAGMLLADLGATVMRIDRPTNNDVFPGSPRDDILNRGKRSIVLDLKKPAAVSAALKIAATADVLIEGLRPGVAERIGIGPEECWELNPKLIYGRMTGWGQDGPLSRSAGHDINYISLTGALFSIGAKDERPQVPLNLVGDFGGGGTFLVIGVLAALREAERSGRGQVVDAAMVDGAASLMAGINALRASGTWKDERGSNMLDGGVPYYDVYRTSDGRHMAVGSLEPKFFAELMRLLEIDWPLDRQTDPKLSPELRAKIAHRFESQPMAHWTAVFEGTDACVSPILHMGEAPHHEHVAAREAVIVKDGVVQPGAAPRFSRSNTAPGGTPPIPGEHTQAILEECGVPDLEELFVSEAAIAR